MSTFGLLLLFATAVGIVGTGLPAYVVLLAGSCAGAAMIWLTGVVPFVLLTALPGRLVTLFENDLLQALPLYVFMGVLLDRLPVGQAIFRTLCALLPRRPYTPLLAGMGLGAVLGPLNGSVGASVVALSRSLAPRFAEARIPAPTGHAVVAVASTLGVLVPPSLVLILLADAMLSAHTIALTATHAAARAINTQDLFRGALLPAAALVVLCLFAAWFAGRRLLADATTAVGEPLRAGEIGVAGATLALLVILLGGVALGYFYAVEAAATGAFLLFVGGIVSGKLRRGTIHTALAEVLATVGALFAPLIAATTFTLILRVLGTDRLVGDFVAAIPGGQTSAVVVVLIVFGISTLALDAFEIIFVVVPILIPPLLMRVPDAVWVGVLVLLALQTSFLLPPFGYALMMTRGRLAGVVSTDALVRALAPFLLAQALVLSIVVAAPFVVHIVDGTGAPTLANDPQRPPADVERSLREMLRPKLQSPPRPSFGPSGKS